MKEKRIEVTHKDICIQIELELACFFFLYMWFWFLKRKKQTNSVHKRKRYTSKQVKTEEEGKKICMRIIAQSLFVFL